ncbi:TPA: class IIb bacteriocin, lactobin A/cerein 7B family [Streptococcus suis]
MTNFKVIDNTNFMALSEAEMMETEGGFATGLGIAIGTVAVYCIGYMIGKNK